ncbi:APC family permease [Caldiplasma sukawensis]
MLTKWQAIFIGLGNIIGAGIFVLAGSAISDAGPGAIIAFIITAILALTISLNSAELSSKIISHGGLYSFTRETMGDGAGFIMGWMRSISYGIAASAVSIGFGSYISAFIKIPYFLILFIAAILIALGTAIDYGKINTVAKIEHILVYITVSGLVLFLLASVFYGKWVPARFEPFQFHGFTGILEAASLSFFAYSGFNTIATLGPEVENPSKNLPAAIISALAISTSLYMLIVLGMLALMPYQLYGINGNPMSIALEYAHVPQFISYSVDFVAIIATFTVTLSLIVAGSRTLLQMSEDRLLPKFIQGRQKDSPKRATIIIGAVAVAFLFAGNVQLIALVSNFGVIVSYAVTGISVMILRKRKVKGDFQSPLYPYVQIVSVILSALIMLTLGVKAFYTGTITIFIGGILYLYEKERKRGSNRDGPVSSQPT